LSVAERGTSREDGLSFLKWLRQEGHESAGAEGFLRWIRPKTAVEALHWRRPTICERFELEDYASAWRSFETVGWSRKTNAAPRVATEGHLGR